MQILRLELSGIGPYAGTEHVDFSRLGADGLFLLEGATGSGKTTIIDAIVFALYGQVAADDSSGDRMVSTHRKAASEPYVDLVVDTSRGLYRVRRTPQFTRPKKRGEGLTSVNATIRLWKLADPDDQDGEPISANIQDANKELQAAIGLSRDQFTQTVVLPQGHFANFLRSKPEERRGLLQQIFGTELFERAQQELTAMAADYKARADQARTQIRSLAERFAHSAWPDEAPTPDGSPASEATPVPADETPAGHQDVPAAGPTPREAFLTLLDDDDTAPLVAAAHARLRELQADTEQRTQAVAGARERLGGARAARDAAQRIIALKAEHDALVVQRQGLEARGDQIAADRVRLDAATRAAGSARPLAAARRAASALSTATTEWEVVAAEIAATDDGVLLEQVRPHAVGNLGSPDGSDDAALSTLRDEITRLGTTRGQLGQLAQLEAGLPARHARLDADNARLAEITARITTTQQELAELIAGRDELSQRHGQLPPTDDALTSASLAQQAATRTLEAAQAAEQDASQLVALLAAEQEAIDAADLAEREYRTARAGWLDGLAGTLAGELVDGDECPVCGATSHPHPATPAEGAATRDDVERLAQQARSLADARARAAMQCDVAAQHRVDHQKAAGGKDVAQARADLDRADAELAGASAAADQRVELTARIADADRQVTTTRSTLAELQASASGLKGAIATATTQLDDDHHQIDRHREDYPDIAGRLAHVARRLDAATRIVDALQALAAARREGIARRKEADQALADAGFATPDEAGAAMLDAEQIAALRQSITDFDTRRARIAAQLERAELVAAVASPVPDLESLDTKLADAEQAQEAAELALGRATAHLAQSRQAAEELEAASLALTRMAPEAAPVVRMAELATAGDRNLRKVTLPTYVLLRRFEQVIDQANDRLESMTHGRYSLQRTDEKEGRSRKLGLGLVVIDHLPVDTARETQTLSGGETFLASLAMALGLSDTVTAEAGGISLDSLFVDEGFGSLDPESLDMVMGQLEKLRAGGRNVGVVSHVTEMKQRIAERISVRKLPDGSSTLTTTVDD